VLVPLGEGAFVSFCVAADCISISICIRIVISVVATMPRRSRRSAIMFHAAVQKGIDINQGEHQIPPSHCEGRAFGEMGGDVHSQSPLGSFPGVWIMVRVAMIATVAAENVGIEIVVDATRSEEQTT